MFMAWRSYRTSKRVDRSREERVAQHCDALYLKIHFNIQSVLSSLERISVWMVQSMQSSNVATLSMGPAEPESHPSPPSSSRGAIFFVLSNYCELVAVSHDCLGMVLDRMQDVHRGVVEPRSISDRGYVTLRHS